ncbi:hypothetical protein Tco_0481114 [Tanacetum coccineum]
MSTLNFADTHNMVAFLGKPAESDGFHKIRYALTVNPTIYTSCIEQIWATATAKTVNGERQIQALIDKQKKRTEGERRKNKKRKKEKKKKRRERERKRERNETEIEVKKKKKKKHPPPQEEPWTFILPLSKIERRKSEEKKEEERRNNPGENRGRTLQLLKRRHNKMLVFLHLPRIHLSVAMLNSKGDCDLKKRVQKLERKKKLRTTGFKRLRKVGMSRRVKSSEDKESLGDHEDASKQGRRIEDIDKDADVSLVDDT